jgi:hypothetical protein
MEHPAMEVAVKKSELIQCLQDEDRRWTALLEQIGSARMDQPGVNGKWSMKDIVAHLTGWHRHLVACLEAAQRGEPKPPPPWPARMQTEDEINAWIYESNRGRPLRAVLDEAHEVNRHLLDVIDGLPDEVRIERIEPAFLLVWVGEERFLVSEFYNHFHDDHEPDVHAWLARLEQA